MESSDTSRPRPTDDRREAVTGLLMYGSLYVIVGISGMIGDISQWSLIIWIVIQGGYLLLLATIESFELDRVLEKNQGISSVQFEVTWGFLKGAWNRYFVFFPFTAAGVFYLGFAFTQIITPGLDPWIVIVAWIFTVLLGCFVAVISYKIFKTARNYRPPPPEAENQKPSAESSNKKEETEKEN